MGFNHDDPSLKTGAGGLTVWTLREMAGDRRFNELNDLFNNGLTMNSLPVGLAAGAAARVLDLDNKLIADALDHVTGKNWRGKVFFTSNNKSFFVASKFPDRPDVQVRYDASGQPSPDAGGKIERRDSELS